jgi:hypothetical protein
MKMRTHTYWDEEAFREITVGPSFGEIRSEVEKILTQLKSTLR